MENFVLGVGLSEYHTGYRAYSRQVLEEVPFLLNSDKFVFDQKILVQALYLGFRVREVVVPTKYFRDASSAGFIPSTVYGLNILVLLSRYMLHRLSLIRLNQSQSFIGRYRRVD